MPSQSGMTPQQEEHLKQAVKALRTSLAPAPQHNASLNDFEKWFCAHWPTIDKVLKDLETAVKIIPVVGGDVSLGIEGLEEFLTTVQPILCKTQQRT